MRPALSQERSGRAAVPPVGTSVAVTLACLAIVLIGWADYATGIEVRLYPLYFMPIAIISACAPRRLFGLLAAAVCTCVWLFSNWHAGMSHYATDINVVNTLMQLSAFALVAMLISGYRDALDRERILARSDVLTGLLNPRGFAERANVEVARSRRVRGDLALALLDLDRFKQVNDSRGHATGDDLLRVVGRILAQRLRRTDVAARLGGDEFAILMPETSIEGAEALLESVRESVAAAAATRELPVTASIGLCMFKDHVPDLDSMLRDADQLLYAAKLAGRNRVVAGAPGREGSAPRSAARG